MQWLKPMQKTGLGAMACNSACAFKQFASRPRITSLRTCAAALSKYQQDVQERGKRHSHTPQPFSTSTGPLFPTGRVLLQQDAFFCKVSCIIPSRLPMTGEHGILNQVRIGLCRGMIWRKTERKHSISKGKRRCSPAQGALYTYGESQPSRA